MIGTNYDSRSRMSFGIKLTPSKELEAKMRKVGVGDYLAESFYRLANMDDYPYVKGGINELTEKELGRKTPTAQEAIKLCATTTFGRLMKPEEVNRILDKGFFHRVKEMVSGVEPLEQEVTVDIGETGIYTLTAQNGKKSHTIKSTNSIYDGDSSYMNFLTTIGRLLETVNPKVK